MSQISTVDIAQLLQLANAGRGSSSSVGVASRIPLGQLVQAEVIQALGDGLFKLSIGSTTVTASSQVPLTAGDQLNLETSRDSAGTVNLRLLNQTSLSSNGLAAKGTGDAVTLSVTHEESGPSAALSEGSRAAASARLAGLVRPGGAIAQLVNQRPDLAPRIETLLRSVADRQSSLGTDIQSLQRQVDQIASFRASSPESTAVADQSTRLLDQLLGKSALDNPKQLAETLAVRLTSLARGLEGSIAQVSTPTVAPVAPTITPTANTQAIPTTPVEVTTPSVFTPSQPELVARTVVAEQTLKLIESLPVNQSSDAVGRTLVEDNNLNSAERPTNAPRVFDVSATPVARNNPTDVVVENKFAVPPSGEQEKVTQENSATVNRSFDKAMTDAATTTLSPSTRAAVQGTFDGDLKGQLLELRTQLTTLADHQPEAASSVQQAIQRTDMLVNQVTAQQIRNVDGLNQYVHVQLPIDPKTGVQDAHLQVFYRHQNSGSDGAAEEDNRFTVALFLNLSKLGDVLATVTGVDGTISVGFTVNSPETKELLSGSLDELRSGLLAAGHEGAMITVREMPRPETASPAADAPEDDLWDEFLSQSPLSTEAGSRLDQEA